MHACTVVGLEASTAHDGVMPHETAATGASTKFHTGENQPTTEKWSVTTRSSLPSTFDGSAVTVPSAATWMATTGFDGSGSTNRISSAAVGCSSNVIATAADTATVNPRRSAGSDGAVGSMVTRPDTAPGGPSTVTTPAISACSDAPAATSIETPGEPSTTSLAWPGAGDEPSTEALVTAATPEGVDEQPATTPRSTQGSR